MEPCTITGQRNGHESRPRSITVRSTAGDDEVTIVVANPNNDLRLTVWLSTAQANELIEALRQATGEEG